MRKQDLESAIAGLSPGDEQIDYERARRMLEPGTSSGALAVEAAMYEEEQAVANQKLLREFIHRLPIVQYRWWRDDKTGAFTMLDTQAEAKFFQSSVFWSKVPHETTQPEIQPCYLVGLRSAEAQGKTEILLQPAAVQTYGSISGTNINAGEAFSATMATDLLEAAQVVGQKNINEPYDEEAYSRIFHKEWKKFVVTRRSPGSLSFASAIGVGKNKPGKTLKYKKHGSVHLTDKELESYRVLHFLGDLSAKFGTVVTLDKLLEDRWASAAEHPLDVAISEASQLSSPAS